MDLEIAKWYLDCVAPDGETFIGYAARIRWRRVSAGYAHSLHYRPEHGAVERSSLRGVHPPRHDVHGWIWECRPLAVEGRWTPLDAQLDETLYEDGNTRVAWSCVAPRADVRVTVDGRTIRGNGYVERVEVVGTPRHVPLRELWWGRFHTDDRTVVWIEWRGAHPLRRVFVDGREEPAVIDAHGVTFVRTGARLDLEPGEIVRDAPIASTLRTLPAFLGMLPRRLLETHERKVRSLGTLRGADGSVQRGQAIHEVVRFGGKSPAPNSP